ncbi:MBL fold metallo-hydrolase [Actinomycetes bacterium NPDC127524]
MIIFQNEHTTVFQSGLYQTVSVFIETDQAVFLTDPAWLPAEVEEIRKFVYEKRNGRALYIIFTHSDFDHIIGYKAFEDAIIIASQEFAERPDKEAPLKQIKDFDTRNYITRNYEIAYPEVDIIIHKDSQRLCIGEATLIFYKAPGHTQDGLFTIVEPYGIFIAGDYLSDAEFPFVEGDFEDYITTMIKAKNLLEENEINLLLPGHGSPETSKQNMLKRVRESHEYLLALKSGGPDPEELSKTYKFFEGLKRMHEYNLKMAK